MNTRGARRRQPTQGIPGPGGRPPGRPPPDRQEQGANGALHPLPELRCADLLGGDLVEHRSLPALRARSAPADQDACPHRGTLPAAALGHADRLGEDRPEPAAQPLGVTTRETPRTDAYAYRRRASCPSAPHLVFWRSRLGAMSRRAGHSRKEPSQPQVRLVDDDPNSARCCPTPGAPRPSASSLRRLSASASARGSWSGRPRVWAATSARSCSRAPARASAPSPTTRAPNCSARDFIRQRPLADGTRLLPVDTHWSVRSARPATPAQGKSSCAGDAREA